MSDPVAITGTGVVAPLGALPELWGRGLDRDARSISGPVREIPLDALPEVVRARARRAERVTQLTLAAAGSALATAGLADAEGDARPRLGVVLGTAFGCFLTNAEYQEKLAQGGIAGASPRLFAATVSNAAAGELAIAYRLGGPAVTLTAGSASGLVALAHAGDMLRAERADALVAGGVDAHGAALDAWLRDAGFPPATEAAAILVLETPGSARERRAPVVGTLEGWACGFEPGAGRGRAGDGLAAAIERALADAGIGSRDVSVIASGGSPVEEEALRRSFGASIARRIAPKATLGETFGAAGPLGVLAALAEASSGAIALVLDACRSGHVAALLARVGAPA
jgi:3-oxoacyl-[acyl-carrier-protein] synthase II